LGLASPAQTDSQTREKHHAHRRVKRPALALITDHAAKRVGQRCADQKDQEHFDKPAQGVRVFERMSRICVEEAATVAAQELDRFLRGHGPTRQHLMRAFERGRVEITAQGLRHALRHEKNACDNANWQQNVERDTGQIDPKIANCL
jgi:hypothetical protein